MSLTTVLKNSNDVIDLLTIFCEKLPALDYKQIKAKASPHTRNYGLVGTAYDYLLRYHIEALNPSVVHKNDWLVADLAIRAMSSIGIPTDDIERAKNRLLEGKREVARCLTVGSISRDMLRFCLELAQLDGVYRSGNPDWDRGINDGDVIDLSGLAYMFKESDLRSLVVGAKSIILNPTFGHGSMLVGGADADFIIDDLLVDIKTTKYLHFNCSYMQQLIGYYLLSLIGGVDVNTFFEPEINRLGIYFSRYGILSTVDVSELTELARIAGYDSMNNIARVFSDIVIEHNLSA